MRRIDPEEQAFYDEWEIPLHRCKRCGGKCCSECGWCDSCHDDGLFDSDELGIDPEEDYGDDEG